MKMSSSSDDSSIDLDLSCSFSDAEGSDLEGDPLESASDPVVEPYMYEPLASESEDGGEIGSVDDESQDDQRLLDTNWYVFVLILKSKHDYYIHKIKIGVHADTVL